MTSPETRGGQNRTRHYPLLGLAAYVLVPGERRARAAGHFRRAGFEAARGVGALVRPAPGETGRTAGAPGRQRIEIE